MLGLRQWTPFGSPFQLHREIDSLFDRFFGPTERSGSAAVPPEAAPVSPAFRPAVESYACDGNLHVRVALPGVDPKDVEVSVMDGVLTIRGERKDTTEQKDTGYFMREVVYGAFERSLVLPEGVDPDRIRAKYTNGMLELSMPAPVSVAPKKVEIAIDGGTPERKSIKAA
ncbi:MAG TPA: Hsp20/alpha crystallin family protein [Methylomirabilota bacterium]|nr:Hsp20/alpha crystallin family protein [Methylomirabilota bacterium]